MSEPIISVLMSVYNDETYVAEAVRSLLTQSFENFELVIVDDGSTDRTAELLGSFTDSRLRIVTNAVNVGLTKSLNIAASLARGKYLARQDSNDVSMPTRLEKQLAALEGNSDSVLCATWANMFFTDCNVSVETDFPRNNEEFYQHIASRNVLTHSTILFRNLPTLRYREKFVFAQDYDLYLNIATRRQKIIVVPECLVCYRVSSNAISFSKRVQQHKFKKIAQEFYLQREARGSDDYETLSVENVLNAGLSEAESAEYVREQLSANFNSGNLNGFRVLYKQYLSREKACDRYLIMYAATFFPRRFLIPLVRWLKSVASTHI
jgi:glycosyltransferase involved in cell wall biosynthesis